MTPLLQPDGTPMCGQTCVAMVAGVSLIEASTAIGVSVMKFDGTNADHLIRGLKRLNIKVGRWVDYSTRKKRMVDIPPFAIMSIVNTKNAWGHWVVVKDGFVYDPGIGYPLPVHIFEAFIIERAYSRRFTSAKDKHKSVRAYWGEAIPIEEQRDI